jgi:hypothetical protein
MYKYSAYFSRLESIPTGISNSSSFLLLGLVDDGAGKPFSFSFSFLSPRLLVVVILDVPLMAIYYEEEGK